jgi:antitoxin component of RelBE/YafQ-DinJ toxin-antitoxin module
MFTYNQKPEFSNELDTTITIRVNSELKQEFDKLCKSNYSNVSKELNTFMRKVVSKQKLDIENHNVMF